MTTDLSTASTRAAECAASLQAALRDAGPMASLVLLPLIKRAADLQTDIRAALLAARDESST